MVMRKGGGEWGWSDKQRWKHGLGHVCHARKHENLVELWKGYNRDRIIIFGKIILMLREQF